MALAAGALKALLARMTDRGTPFPWTSTFWKLSSGFAATCPSFIKGGLSRRVPRRIASRGISSERKPRSHLSNFLIYLGQDARNRPQLEELSWLM